MRVENEVDRHAFQGREDGGVGWIGSDGLHGISGQQRGIGVRQPCATAAVVQRPARSRLHTERSM